MYKSKGCSDKKAYTLAIFDWDNQKIPLKIKPAIVGLEVIKPEPKVDNLPVKTKKSFWTWVKYIVWGIWFK